MSSFGYIPVDLYKTAMALFNGAGHATSYDPIYINHSPEQVVYFDCQVNAFLSVQQRDILNLVDNISYLFDVPNDCFKLHSNGSCGFYSIEILSSKSSRSYVAYDVHAALIPFLQGNVNIILFRHDGQLMITMQGYDSDVFLSDWYDEACEIDQLSERIDIGNISLNSPKAYLSDFIYSCARWYYTNPISAEQATYDMLPIDCFSTTNLDAHSYSTDELKEMITDALRTAEIEYGHDYVGLDAGNNTPTIDITAELDLLTLDIDMDEEFEMSPFDDEYELEDNDVEDEAFDEGEREKDEYEFADFEDVIFQDPLQMLKLLEATDKQEKADLTFSIKEKASIETTVDLASYFRNFGLEVIDKRKQGGCLWVIGDEATLIEYVKLAENEYNVVGGFATGKATGGRFGWYTKSNK